MVQFAALHLGFVLALVLLLSLQLVAAELDLLAYVVLATYSSVFLALALLLLHFGPFWGGALGWQPGQPRARVARWAGVISIAGGLAVAAGGAGLGPSEGVVGAVVVWQDIVGEGRVSLRGAVSILHFFLYHLYVAETWGLNVLIGLGLVLALLILGVRWAAWGRSLEEARLGGVGVHQTRERVRVVTSFRRQVRRANTTRVRTKR